MRTRAVEVVKLCGLANTFIWGFPKLPGFPGLVATNDSTPVGAVPKQFTAAFCPVLRKRFDLFDNQLGLTWMVSVPKFSPIPSSLTPRLSIIVPIGRDLAAFERTLISVLENQPTDCEVLVPHDGSLRGSVSAL